MTERVVPERLLASILGSTEDGLLSFALDGTIQTWSCGAERLYGYTAAEMTGHPLARLLPVSEVQVYDGLLRTAINGDFPHCENRERLHKDGSIVPVTLTHIPIRNEQGAITGILERGQMPSWNSGSETPEAQLRFLAEQMPLALWTTDQNLRITSNWGAGLLAARIRPGELVGRSVFEYLKCQDPHTAPILQALRSAAGHLFAVRVQTEKPGSGGSSGAIAIGDRRNRRVHRGRIGRHGAQGERRANALPGHARRPDRAGELPGIPGYARAGNLPRRTE